MGATRYVGRVGGLAVALGVGTAIVTGQGIALADDGTTGSAGSASADGASKSATSSEMPPSTGTSSTKIETTSTKTTSTKTTSTKTTSAKTTTAPEPSGTTPTGTSTSSNTVAPGVVVSAQTATGTSGSAPTTQVPAASESPALPTEPAPTTTSAPEPTEIEEPGDTATPPTQEPTPTASPKPTGGNDRPTSSTLTAKPAVPVASIPATGPAAIPQNKSVTLASTEIAAVPTASTTTVVSSELATIEAKPVVAVSRSVDQPPSAAVSPRNPLTVVANMVSNVVNWMLGPVAGTDPSAPVENPLGWTLLAFVRREFENFVSAVGGTRTTSTPSTPATPATLTAETTSLALAAAPLAAAAVAAVNVPNFPLPGTQFSPSTSFVNWVTGNYQTGNPLIADTANRFGIVGTDVGVAWDNGMVDDPATPYDEHQILMAFGDTFSGPTCRASGGSTRCCAPRTPTSPTASKYPTASGSTATSSAVRP